MRIRHVWLPPKNLYVMATVLVFSFSYGLSYGQQPDAIKSNARDALLEAMGQPRGTWQWSRDELEPLVDLVLSLHRDAGRTLTPDEAATLGKHIQSLPHFQVLPDDPHPTVRQLVREEIQYYITASLYPGQPTLSSRGQYTEKVYAIIAQWEEDCHRQYPDKAVVIRDAAGQVKQVVDDRLANSLLGEGASPPSNAAVLDANNEWSRELSNLAETMSMDPSDFLLQSYIASLFQRSLRPVRIECTSLPEPPDAYKMAVHKFRDELRQISQWQADRTEAYLADERTKIAMLDVYEHAKHEFVEYTEDTIKNIGEIESTKTIVEDTIVQPIDDMSGTGVPFTVVQDRSRDTEHPSRHDRIVSITTIVIIAAVVAATMAIVLVIHRRVRKTR